MRGDLVSCNLSRAYPIKPLKSRSFVREPEFSSFDVRSSPMTPTVTCDLRLSAEPVVLEPAESHEFQLYGW